MSNKLHPLLLAAGESDDRMTVKFCRSQIKYSEGGGRWRPIGLVLGLGVLFLALSSMFTPAILAQSPRAWTEVLVLSEATTSWSRPTVAVDPWGHVHVFWTEKYGEEQLAPGQDVGQGDTLYHALWDGQRWSEALDIMVKEASALTMLYPYATVGADGQIYVIWSGGNGLYFSCAPALNAHDAASWQPAQVIVEGPGVDQSRLVVGSGGRLHVVYAKLQGELGGNVAYTESADEGVTWSLPQAISEVHPGEDKVSAAPQMVLDDRGWLHVVWAEKSPPDWIGHRILYSRSEDDGETWTSPEPLADHQPYEQWAEHPSLAAAGDGKLGLVWVCGAAQRCHRASADRGRTWSPRERILGELLGSSGGDAIAADHEGTLHLIAQLRYPGGIYYAFKPANGAWSQPLRVVSRPDFTGGHFFHAALSGGNQLHGVWQKTSQEGDIVYLRITTSALPLTPPVIPTITSSPKATTERQTPTGVATSGSEGLDRTPVPPAMDDTEPTSQPATPAQAVLWGILPAAAMIVLVVGLRLKR